MSHVTITHRRSIAAGDSLVGLVEALVRRSFRGWAEVSYVDEDHASVVVCVPVREPHLIEIHAHAELVVPESFSGERWELWQLLATLCPISVPLPHSGPGLIYKTYLNRGAA